MRKEKVSKLIFFIIIIIIIVVRLIVFKKKLFFFTHILRKRHTKLYKDMSERTKKKKEIKTHTQSMIIHS